MKGFLKNNKSILITAALAAGYFYLFLQPVPFLAGKHSTLCLFHTVTGLPCPTCGTGRGLICLLHGEFYEAIMFNPLSFVVVVLSLVVVFMLMKDWYRNTNSFENVMHIRIPIIYQLPFWLLLIANEVWNICKGV